MTKPKDEETMGAARFAGSAVPDLSQSKTTSDQVVVQNLDADGFTAIAKRSSQVPVILVLTAEASLPSLELATLMEAMVQEYDGRLLLGVVDLPANPAIAQALQIQAVPTVMALIKGQPVPLFQGSAESEQIRALLEQVLQAAASVGVTGVRYYNVTGGVGAFYITVT